MRKGVTIAIVGPPHSGKSRFTNILLKLLNHNTAINIDSTPDGQIKSSTPKGLTNNESIRCKSIFTQESVEKALNDINTNVDKIVLVDTGGKASKENDEILRNCTHAIVLCNDKIKDKNNNKRFWENYCRKMGLSILASLDSSLEGKDKLYSQSILNKSKTLKGTITNLGDNKEITDELKTIASRIEELYTQRGLNFSNNTIIDEQVNNSLVIDMKQISYELGYEVDDSSPINFNSKDLLHILGRFENRIVNRNEKSLGIVNANQQWLRFSLAERAKNNGIQNISFYDNLSNSFKEVGHVDTFKNEDFSYSIENVKEYEILEGKAIMSTYEIEDKSYIYLYSNPLVQITPDDYKKLNLPFIYQGKKLYIHCPENHCDEYLAQSVNLSYINRDKYIFNTSEDTYNYVKINSKNKNELGDKIPVDDSSISVNVLKKLASDVYSERQKQFGTEFEDKYAQIQAKKENRATYRKNLNRKLQEVHNGSRESKYMYDPSKYDR